MKINYIEAFACNGSSLKLNAHTTIKKKGFLAWRKKNHFLGGGYVYPWMVSMTFDIVDALYLHGVCFHMYSFELLILAVFAINK